MIHMDCKYDRGSNLSMPFVSGIHRIESLFSNWKIMIFSCICFFTIWSLLAWTFFEPVLISVIRVFLFTKVTRTSLRRFFIGKIVNYEKRTVVTARLSFLHETHLSYFFESNWYAVSVFSYGIFDGLLQSLSVCISSVRKDNRQSRKII